MQKNIWSVYNRTEKYIAENDLIADGADIVVGLSGGADSVCLLRILTELSKKYAYHIHAVHIHHGIRAEAADADEEFCRDLCQKLNVPYLCEKADIPKMAAEKKQSVEECGRNYRYMIFRREASLYENAVIAVAHHKNDQAETVLMHILRGSALRGAAGMYPQSDGIVRPLLWLSRDEIEAFLNEIGQDYRTDETNTDLLYARNRMRHMILPQMCEINPDVIEAIVRFSDNAKEAEDYIAAAARKEFDEIAQVLLVNESPEAIRINAYKLRSSQPLLGRYVIRCGLEECGCPRKDISNVHLEQVRSLCMSTESGRCSLPYGFEAEYESDRLIISSQTYREYDSTKQSESFAMIIDEDALQKGEEQSVSLWDGTTVSMRLFANAYSKEELLHAIGQNTYTKLLDYDKIPFGLSIRTREEKDRIVIDSFGKSQKLQDYFVNAKIERSLRSRIPVVVSHNKVLWVIGYRIADDVKITENTKTILEIKVRKAAEGEGNEGEH